MNLGYHLKVLKSEHCALIVDNGLAKLKNIESQVELNNKEAIIETQNQETVSEAVKLFEI